MPSHNAPIDVGSRKQLLLDQLFFAASDGVTLSVNPPADAGEVIRADRPWENQAIASWCNLVPDPHAGHVKLYYLAVEKMPDGLDGKPRAHCRMCCAVSTDGSTWEKPELGVVDRDGSADNNIVMDGHPASGDEDVPRHAMHETGTVIIDERDAPERRYKMEYMGTPHGIFGAYSADGFRWTVGNNGEPISKAVADSQNVVIWDDRLNKWVGYFRLWAPTRCVCRVETDDFWSWPFLEAKDVVLAADELDAGDGPVNGPNFMPGQQIGGLRYDPDAEPDKVVWLTDDVEHVGGVDVYNQPVTKYPWSDHAYVMPFTLLYHRPNLEEVHLAVSRDGVNWTRPGDRKAWLRPPIDELAGFIYVGPGILRTGHWLDHYYIKMAGWHGGGKPGRYEAIPTPDYCGSIHRARLRLDGYVCADAGVGGGQFVTPPIVFAGKRLELNVDTGASGHIEVGLTPVVAGDQPWERQAQTHAVEACDRIVCNSIRRTVTWNGDADVSALAGKPLRMHVRMRNAKLYAFEFVK